MQVYRLTVMLTMAKELVPYTTPTSLVMEQKLCSVAVDLVSTHRVITQWTLVSTVMVYLLSVKLTDIVAVAPVVVTSMSLDLLPLVTVTVVATRTMTAVLELTRPVHPHLFQVHVRTYVQLYTTLLLYCVCKKMQCQNLLSWRLSCGNTLSPVILL